MRYWFAGRGKGFLDNGEPYARVCFDHESAWQDAFTFGSAIRQQVFITQPNS